MNKILKYLNYKNYYNFIENKILIICFMLGITIKKTNTILGEKIYFNTRSLKEYYLRAKVAFVEEKTTMEWIENYIQPDDIVYDIGANVGSYTILIGKKLKRGSGKLYAFEPESSNFYSLNSNIILNNLIDIVIPTAIAFDSKLNFKKFILKSNEPGSAEHGFTDNKLTRLRVPNPTHIQGVVTLSLKQFCEFENIHFPNHIKIDVDGPEDEIIMNSLNILSDNRLKTLIIEINQEHKLLHEKILECGLSFYKKEKIDFNGVDYNYFYIRK